MTIKRLRRNVAAKKKPLKVMVFEGGKGALAHVEEEMAHDQRVILLVGVENGWAVISRGGKQFPIFGGSGSYLSDFTT